MSRTTTVAVQMDPTTVAEVLFGKARELDIPDLGIVLGSLDGAEISFRQSIPSDRAGLSRSLATLPPDGTLTMTVKIPSKADETEKD